MNANELADAIEKGGKDGFFQDEIVAILRQQQAKIEALKMEIHSLTYGKRFAEYLRKAQEK